MTTALRNWFSIRRVYFAFLHVAIVVLAVEVVLVSRQYRELRASLEPPDPVKIGSPFVLGEIQPLSAQTTLDTTSPMLLYIFSTDCSFCRKNVPVWTRTADTARQLGLQVGALSLDSAAATEAYRIENKVNYPVFVTVDRKGFSSANNVRFVPQTILRDEHGRIQEAWPGFISDSMESVIVKALPIISKHNH